MCSCLPEWNRVLNVLGLDLTEQRPGKLCLSTQILRPAFDTSGLNSTSADFIAWLPRKHWCIEALKLGKGDAHLQRVTVPDSLAGRGSNLRSIVIQRPAFNWAVALDAMRPIQKLEELKVSKYVVRQELASKLAQLIADGAESVTRVDLSRSVITGPEVDVIISAVAKCRKLRELKFCATFGSTGLADFLAVLQYGENLETLDVVEDSGNPDDPTYDVSITVQQNNAQVLAAVAELLTRNLRLKELCYTLYDQAALEGVFKALETNTVLESLVIRGHGFRPSDHDYKIGAMVKAVLARNQALRSLTFKECGICGSAAGVVSEGLRENRTLEVFDMSTCDLDFRAVQALFSALKQNVTLRSLQLDPFNTSLSERDQISAELTRNRWYKRVQMNWEDRDVPGLETALLDPSLCPSSLCISTDNFSLSSFGHLCTAIASSPGIRSLTVFLKYATGIEVIYLHVMLKKNRSLKSITMEDVCGERGSSAIASLGLNLNETATELTLKVAQGDYVLGEMIYSLLKANKTLSKVLIRCTSCIVEPEFVQGVAEGVFDNAFITDCSIFRGFLTECPNEEIRAAVQRNVKCLRRAAGFALSPTVGKDCALTFEKFESKPSLVSCIMETSGMSEAEAQAAVKSAKLFIKANYLVINGVVQSRLECHAGNCTQIDQIGFDCWLAIARYLKISDVSEDETPL